MNPNQPDDRASDGMRDDGREAFAHRSPMISRTPTLHDDDDVVRATRRYAADGTAPFRPLTTQGVPLGAPRRPLSGTTLLGGALGILLVVAVMAALLWSRAGG